MKNLFHRILGDRGERAAVEYLKQQGFRIVARQYRNSYGEVDIIGVDDKTTVFVEVKTRTTTDDGQPFEAVDLRKQEKITRVALAWLKQHGRLEQPSRFDVVSILWPDRSGKPQIQHFRHAFEAIGRGQFFS